MPNCSTDKLVKIARMGKQRLLFGIGTIPEERWNWSPAEGVRPLSEFVDGITRFFLMAAHGVREAEFPPRPATPPAGSASREEAVERLAAAYDTLIEALSNLDEAQLQRPLMMPWGVASPIGEMCWFVATVMGYFQGQLNLYQLCYGDKNPNIPPGWGRDVA